jgi:hypothetical protein
VRLAGHEFSLGSIQHQYWDLNLAELGGHIINIKTGGWIGVGTIRTPQHEVNFKMQVYDGSFDAIRGQRIEQFILS